jgi:hypothetical protein
MANPWDPPATPPPAYQPGEYEPAGPSQGGIQVFTRQPVAPQDEGPWRRPAPTVPPPQSGPVADAIATHAPQGSILNAFGQGFSDEWGSAKFGPELKEWLDKTGILYGPQAAAKGKLSVAQAFNEAFLRPTVDLLDAGVRTMQGVYAGIHDASIEAGHPFDAVAAGMEAFPLAGAELGRMGWVSNRAELAKTGDSRIDRVIDDPQTKSAINRPVVNSDNDVPYSAGPDTEGAGLNIDRQFPKSMTVDGKTFDPAEPFAVHEFVERDTMNKLTKGGMDADAAYRVAHYEFAEKAEGAWYAAHGIDPDHAEAAYRPYIDKIDHENPANPPPRLYKKPYGHSGVKGASQGPVEATPPTPEEIAQAHAILDKSSPTEAPQPRSMLTEARAIGVIGPEPKSINEVSKGIYTLGDDKNLAPFDQTLTDEEFNQRVSTLETPDDVRKLIEAATEHEPFQPARQGTIPAEHLGRLSDITGIPVDELPEAKMRMHMNGDKQYDVAGKILIKAQDNVFEAARAHSAHKSFETRQALIEAIMRRDLALEQIVGLNAEWGRTGNAIQDLYNDVKSAQDLGRFIKERKGEGWNSEKIDQIADDLSKMNSRESVGRYLTELRKPDFLDKAIWYWTNSILSGPITHAKYILANSAYAAFDTLVATPLAGVSGAVRQALSKEQIDRVYLGETVVKAYGQIAGVRDALYAAGKAIKTGVPTPVPAQARGVSRVNPVTQLNPVGGIVGNVVGAPSRVISGIHTFFNFLGYRAELEVQGYRKAAKEGYKPTSGDFWHRQSDHAAFPDDPAMDAAILAGQRENFVQDLGPAGQALTAMLYKTRLGRFVIPFTRVPGNIFNAVQEGTPFAFLDGRMRKALLGSGASKDMAVGRLLGGSSVMGAAAYWTLQGSITGNGPIDPKQRAEWLLTHQPRSFKSNGIWKSYDRFGPVGGWLALSADITDASAELLRAESDGRMTATQVAKANQDMSEGYARIVVGFTHWFEDAGFQGLFDLVESMDDPQKTRMSNLGTVAASALPYSSMLSQTASMFDPQMRETQTFIDGIKRSIPGERQSLLVVRDWSGEPRPNAAYGSILRHQSIGNDSVDEEMQHLDLKPSRVEDNIKGVKLTPEQYDDYQTSAGTITRLALHSLVDQAGWQAMPDFAKSQIIVKSIEASRKQAEAYTQLKYPSLIQEGIDNRTMALTGQKPKPNAYVRPE